VVGVSLAVLVAQPVGALVGIFKAVRPRGTIVKVGVSGSFSSPVNMLVGKEIRWIGSHRFGAEYAEAFHDQRKVDRCTAHYHRCLSYEGYSALDAATDRSQSVKVQVGFED